MVRCADPVRDKDKSPRLGLQTMLIRFDCPACGRSHSFDMPETTIHMTCPWTHRVVRIRLTAGGDPKASVLGDGAASAGEEEEKE